MKYIETNRQFENDECKQFFINQVNKDAEYDLTFDYILRSHFPLVNLNDDLRKQYLGDFLITDLNYRNWWVEVKKVRQSIWVPIGTDDKPYKYYSLMLVYSTNDNSYILYDYAHVDWDDFSKTFMIHKRTKISETTKKPWTSWFVAKGNLLDYCQHKGIWHIIGTCEKK